MSLVDIDTQIRKMRSTWERPVCVDLMLRCQELLRERVERYDTIVDAVNEIDVQLEWSAVGPKMPFGNFTQLYRDELLRRFGSDGRPDQSIIQA